MLSTSILKHLNQLQQKKYRREFKEFVVEGIKGVKEALDNAEVILIIIDGKLREEPEFLEIINLAEKNEVQVEFCARQDIGQIKTTDTFPGVIAIVAQTEVGLEEIANGPIICLDGVKDPGNLGTIIRTADWFGVKNILLSEDSVDPYNPKVARSTMGSIFRVRIFESNNLVGSLEWLKKKEYKLNGLVMKGDDLNKAKIGNKNDIYIFGSESHGIRPEVEKMLDKKYTIPAGVNNNQSAESLNVGIAVGIILYQLGRKN